MGINVSIVMQYIVYTPLLPLSELRMLLDALLFIPG